MLKTSEISGTFTSIRWDQTAAGLLDADLEAIVCVLVPKQKCVSFL